MYVYTIPIIILTSVIFKYLNSCIIILLASVFDDSSVCVTMKLLQMK